MTIFAFEKFADVKRFYITIKEIYFQVTKVFYFYIYDILSVELIDMIPLYYTALYIDIIIISISKESNEHR